MIRIIAILLISTIVLCGDSPDYSFDEGPTGNVCFTDDQCDGSRTCDSATMFCNGEARPDTDRPFKGQN